MRPVVVDKDTGRELWTARQCAEHTGTAASTWRAYVTRAQAPAPVAQLDDRTPLWDAEDVEQWHANRPGHGGQ